MRLLQSHLPDKLWQQPALLSRALAIQAHGDRAAIADDERGQFWSLPVVSSGNREQRMARDQLFVGDDASLAAAGPHWETADDDYTKAEKLTHTVGDALAVRDRAWAEIPYFAAWLARPLPDGEPSDAEDEEINGTLLHLIRAAHGLDATLASPPTTEAAAATESPPFEGEAREVREGIEHLEQLFTKECNRLADTKQRDGRSLRDLQAVLEVSSLPARQREQLRKRAEEIAATLSRDTDRSRHARRRTQKAAVIKHRLTKAEARIALHQPPPAPPPKTDCRWRTRNDRLSSSCISRLGATSGACDFGFR